MITLTALPKQSMSALPILALLLFAGPSIHAQTCAGICQSNQDTCSNGAISAGRTCTNNATSQNQTCLNNAQIDHNNCLLDSLTMNECMSNLSYYCPYCQGSGCAEACSQIVQSQQGYCNSMWAGEQGGCAAQLTSQSNACAQQQQSIQNSCDQAYATCIAGCEEPNAGGVCSETEGRV